MRTDHGTYMRFCRRCGDMFESYFRTSKICKKCKMPVGGYKQRRQCKRNTSE